MTINNGEQVIDLAKALGAMAKEADMVCVVRCKDCKHHSHDAGYGYDWCNRTLGVFRVKKDSFCSFAERKDNG